MTTTRGRRSPAGTGSAAATDRADDDEPSVLLPALDPDRGQPAR